MISENWWDSYLSLHSSSWTAASSALVVTAPQPGYLLNKRPTCSCPAGRPWMFCASIFLWISPQTRGRLFRKQEQGTCWWCFVTAFWDHNISLSTNSKSSLRYGCNWADTPFGSPVLPVQQLWMDVLVAVAVIMREVNCAIMGTVKKDSSCRHL